MSSAVPTPPPGLTVPEFGEKLWGHGDDDARRRTANIQRHELEALGLTRELANRWLKFYQAEAIRGRGLPTSPERAKLLERCVELLQ